MVIYNNSSKFSDKVQKCQEYIGALVEERKKIQVFERELPLCLDLVSQAIERYKQQMSESFDDQSDYRCCDQTSNESPVLEEFIPMKLSSFANEDINDHQQPLSHKSNFTSSKNWLASVQLSLQTPDHPPTIEDNLLVKNLISDEHKNGCNTFNPLKKVQTTTRTSSPDTVSGGFGGGGDNGGSHGEDKGRSNKKERRSWSPELHRRFLNALQQLGGANVATPKQIRELMKVNGLTNDEIKSHLQKYRLYTKRLNPTIHNDKISSQLVVVGQIWMPPLDYTANVASSTYKIKQHN